MTARVRPAAPGDRPAVEALLSDADLPLEGTVEVFDDFLVALEDERVVGAIGLETYDDDGLLRSAVVASGIRSAGVGSALTEALIDRARSRGLRHLYLLTTTAEGFFARFGFRRIARERVPGSIRGSSEFATVCPSDAIVMVLDLEADGPV